ncbi:MAG TPA: hypothetical protein VFS59_09220 [Gemmatimonadaceae bacterium]|nr:hypothetical protein [Gemmatimonadaceae bacterium]
MHRKVAVAIAAALALVAAGCGGSETDTTTLSRAALVRRVEAACTAAQAASTRQAEATRTPDPIAVLRAGQRVLLERIEGLAGSGEAEDAFDDFKEGVRARMDAIEEVAAASRADRQRVLREVEADAEEAGRKLDGAIRNLGLGTCS